MSSIAPRGKKGLYTYYGNDGHKKALKTNNETIARMLQNKLDKQIMLSDNGLPDRDMTWGEWKAEYMDWHRKIHKFSTCRGTWVSIRAFQKILSLSDKAKLLSIKQKDCETWQVTRAQQILPQTVNCEHSGHLAPMFKKAHERGYIERNPFGDLTPLVFTREESRVFTFDEVSTVVDRMEGKGPYAVNLALFAYDTGMRRSEIVHQMIENIDFTKGLLFVKNHDKECRCLQCNRDVRAGRPRGWTTKTRQERVIPLTPRLHARLLGLFQEQKTGCVFPQHESGLKYGLHIVYKSLGIAGACLHTFRHTFANEMDLAGVRPKVIQKILGHSDVGRGISRTTSGYLHTAEGELHEGLQKLLEWRESQKTKISKNMVDGIQVIERAQ